MNKRVIAILILLFSGLSVMPATADHHYNKCDNKVETEKGELAGGPFLGLGMFMSMHFITERYCGGTIAPRRSILEKHLTKNGCNSDTEIYKTLMDGEQKMSSWSLSQYILEGSKDPSLTENDAREQLKDIVDNELGGCEALIESMSKELGVDKN